MSTSFEGDLEAYGRSGFPAVELWLTKLEDFLADGKSYADVRALLEKNRLTALAASAQGGLLLSRGAERATHWDHFRRRLEILRQLGIPTLVVTSDFVTEPREEDYARAAAALAEAGEVAGTFGVRLALEFQKQAKFCSCLETTLAVITQSGAKNVGVCLDLFHYYTGPSKFEDLGWLTVDNLAWVQVSDVSGTPRELAGDADRVLPGDGDFRIEPIIDHLGEIGYKGGVSLEVLNPMFWQIPPDRVADMGCRSVERVLRQWNSAPVLGGA